MRVIPLATPPPQGWQPLIADALAACIADACGADAAAAGARPAGSAIGGQAEAEARLTAAHPLAALLAFQPRHEAACVAFARQAAPCAVALSGALVTLTVRTLPARRRGA